MIGEGLQKRSAGTYRLAFSGDTALELPAAPDARERALRIARETDGWEAITKPHERPWLFHMRPLSANLLSMWQSQKDENGNDYAGTEHGMSELFRIALVGVENIEGVEVKRRAHKKYGSIAEADVLDIFPRAMLATVIGELGMAILTRERDLGPK